MIVIHFKKVEGESVTISPAWEKTRIQTSVVFGSLSIAEDVVNIH